MRNNWIVVADAGRARLFFKTEENDHPVLLREFNNIAGHAWEHMFVTHAMDDRSLAAEMDRRGVRLGFDDPDLMLTQHFALDLCRLLEQAADRGAYDRLVLIAPNSFLALLQQKIGPSAKRLLAATMAKVLMDVPGPRLEEHLCMAGI